MRRLGIFVFYDCKGQADRYVNYLLSQMKEVLSDIVIVVNGELNAPTLKMFQTFSRKIIIRENKGYDGGAYKEAILDYLTRDEIEGYDELVLFNDTFYGPFFSMERIFRAFESEDVDFWGMTRWVEGESLSWNMRIPDHIQAYFIVIKKDMLHSDNFYDFWNDLKCPNSYLDAVMNYEVAFSTYFKACGYKSTAWIDMQGTCDLLQPAENVYTKYLYELVREYEFPFLKRKSINLENFTAVKKLLQLIEDRYEYDIKMISEHEERLEKLKQGTPFLMKRIEEFCDSHRDIYIFGHGKLGILMKSYLDFLNVNVTAFVVTVPNPLDEVEIGINELEIAKEDGIIAALGRDNFKQVEGILRERFKEEQLLMPNY